jgi:type IV pilus assembly protein PilQ
MGWLFKNRLLTTKKTELLVFITPKIVTDRTTAAR